MPVINMLLVKVQTHFFFQNLVLTSDVFDLAELSDYLFNYVIYLLIHMVIYFITVIKYQICLFWYKIIFRKNVFGK